LIEQPFKKEDLKSSAWLSERSQVMLGCMTTETSCAISAAIQFASLVDYADLDGNVLITNDLYLERFACTRYLTIS